MRTEKIEIYHTNEDITIKYYHWHDKKQYDSICIKKSNLQRISRFNNLETAYKKIIKHLEALENNSNIARFEENNVTSYGLKGKKFKIMQRENDISGYLNIGLGFIINSKSPIHELTSTHHDDE